MASRWIERARAQSARVGFAECLGGVPKGRASVSPVPWGIRALSIMLAALLCAASAAAQVTITPPDTTQASSKFRSAEDGWLDVSGFLDERYGFLPVVIPITEPAVGYGAATGLVFISQPLGEARADFGRPDIEVARKYGIHVGLDLAVGPDSTAVYLEVGSAWARP